MPSTTAARSISATMERSTSRPASTSTPATRRISRVRAARSCASTWTAPSRPTTRSTTAPDPTTTRYGRWVCAIPIRAYYDAPTGRLIIGDVGGNDYSTAIEEVDIGARGANYGWPNVEGA